MPETFVIADLHINHINIIEYTQRSFNDIFQMNNYIIDQWNSTINDDDIVYVLGDFGFGSVENLTHIVNLLYGYKILIMGNHDRRRSVSWWLNVGFNEVYKKPIEIKNLLLSHEPQIVSSNQINIHGHIHNNPLPKEFNPNNHICVSVELHNYKPVNIKTIIKHFN